MLPVDIVYLAIAAAVILLPLVSRRVEHNLELFFLAVGILTATVAHLREPEPVLTAELVRAALTEPIRITIAVLVASYLFHFFHHRVTHGILFLQDRCGGRVFGWVLVASLGLASSFITAIIAALILSEVMTVLRADEKRERQLVVICCFSIGLGAALTPVGEPLSTIAVAKLRGDFFYLARIIGAPVLCGICALAALGGMVLHGRAPSQEEQPRRARGDVREIWLRTGKVYLFILALMLLGHGFQQAIDRYVVRLPGAFLYWFNSLSAVLDNATLAAAELSPKMTVLQIRMALMGLLVAGGMLIPGNIPNIICAGKLRISSRDWAMTGVPLGTALMGVYFVVFLFLH